MLHDAVGGLTIGLALTAFAFGLRHGVDWDHLAAIVDITGTQERRRRGLVLSTLYAAGHGAVVLVLGAAAITTGRSLPPWLDEVMGRIVGATLLILAAVIVVSLLRERRAFRMRSRWVLVGAGMSHAVRWARARVVEIVHDHPHGDAHGHRHDDAEVAPEAAPCPVATTTTHRHEHRHVAVVPDDPFATRPRSVLLLGAIHGIGAETPTQVVLFLTASRVSGTLGAVALLVLFVTGIFVANGVIAVGASSGAIDARRSFTRYAALAVVNAAFSTVVGAVFLLGGSLPTILGG